MDESITEKGASKGGHWPLPMKMVPFEGRARVPEFTDAIIEIKKASFLSQEIAFEHGGTIDPEGRAALERLSF
jgi:hypothetical protein